MDFVSIQNFKTLKLAVLAAYKWMFLVSAYPKFKNKWKENTRTHIINKRISEKLIVDLYKN
jgi:hypothetical protein